MLPDLPGFRSGIAALKEHPEDARVSQLDVEYGLYGCSPREGDP